MPHLVGRVAAYLAEPERGDVIGWVPSHMQEQTGGVQRQPTSLDEVDLPLGSVTIPCPRERSTAWPDDQQLTQIMIPFLHVLPRRFQHAGKLQIFLDFFIQYFYNSAHSLSA